MAMSDFPLRFTVAHQVYVADGEDAHGNAVDAWADPVIKKVYGWGAPQTNEPKLAGHNRDIVELEVLVPPGFECGPRDRMTLDSVLFEVVGGPEMSDHNPFGWNPGGVVNLVRVNG